MLKRWNDLISTAKHQQNSRLAYVDLICTDKTGTLTTGIMTPKTIIDGNGNG